MKDALGDGRSGARILVVDDDRDCAETMASLLTLFGHDVHVAFDGHEAMDLVLRLPFDHVLLDLGLPGLSGLEVAARVRERCACRPTLTAITGYGRRDEKLRPIPEGFDHLFVKPFEPSVLLSLIQYPKDGTSDPDGDGRTDRRLDMAFPTIPNDAPPSDGRIAGAVAPLPSATDGTLAAPPGERSADRTDVCSRRVLLMNAEGLHLRAISRFVRLASQFESEISVSCDGTVASGRSILDLITLGAGCGSWIVLEAVGPDCRRALESLSTLMERGFEQDLD